MKYYYVKYRWMYIGKTEWHHVMKVIKVKHPLIYVAERKKENKETFYFVDFFAEIPKEVYDEIAEEGVFYHY